MIAIDLQCINDHVFEGWFEDHNAFEDQKEKGLIECPFCKEITVTRIPSTFSIKSSPPTRKMTKRQNEWVEVGKKIIDFVEKNFDNVGADFAKEALKIHYGAAEPRNIRGVSTHEEEKLLEKEGIEFCKFPMPIESEDDSES